ncbi:hypothetical protein K456DRAFT_59615 [Colletotrichum gloeosporioides 23]|nr:hypothetical protein K456DRAFT_59615 [Colletotrichum gloeosporioides 23]
METQSSYHNNNEDDISTMEWQVRSIEGHSQIDGELYYDVVWEPTWEPGLRLQHMAKEIIAWNKRHDYSDYKRQPLRQFDPTLKHWSGKVIGRDERDGQTHYKIEWQITREPETNLEHAKGLLSEYWRRHRTESSASVEDRNGMSS